MGDVERVVAMQCDHDRDTERFAGHLNKHGVGEAEVRVEQIDIVGVPSKIASQSCSVENGRGDQADPAVAKNGPRRNARDRDARWVRVLFSAVHGLGRAQNAQVGMRRERTDLFFEPRALPRNSWGGIQVRDHEYVHCAIGALHVG
jgi:hypothetical protein